MPFANTGMFTACLQQKEKKQKTNKRRFVREATIKHYESSQVNQTLEPFNHCCICVMFLSNTQFIEDAISLAVQLFLPHCLDVLPAGDASHGSFLLFGSAVHRQQLGPDRTAPRLTASRRCLSTFATVQSKACITSKCARVTPGSRLSPASERSGPSSPPR